MSLAQGNAVWPEGRGFVVGGLSLMDSVRLLVAA